MATILRFATAMAFSAVVGYLALDAMTKWGVAAIGFAVFLNAILPMGIVVVFHLILPRFPPHAFAFDFTPRRWERQGTIDRYSGVLPFQTFLKITSLGWRRKAGYQVRRDRAFLESMLCSLPRAV